jgi:hypothetical protein
VFFCLTLLGRRGRLPLTHIICGLLFELGLFNFFSSIWAYHLFEMILLFRAKYLDLHYLILFCLILVNHEMNLLVRGIGVCSFVSCYLGDIVRPTAWPLPQGALFTFFYSYLGNMS